MGRKAWPQFQPHQWHVPPFGSQPATTLIDLWLSMLLSLLLHVCLAAGLSHAKAGRCQGRGIPEGHALRETSNWARTRFSKSVAADLICLVPSNVRVAYVTRRRATPREGDGGRRKRRRVQEDRGGKCVTSAPQLAAYDSLNHNISANSVTGNRCEALNLLVGSGRSM